jgi:hypothetical protein
MRASAVRGMRKIARNRMRRAMTASSRFDIEPLDSRFLLRA